MGISVLSAALLAVACVLSAFDPLHMLQLESYQLRAVTEGEDALGEVTVRVSNEGVTMLGKGVSTDIIEASCLAYLNAANRIIEARQEQEKAHQQETGV